MTEAHADETGTSADDPVAGIEGNGFPLQDATYDYVIDNGVAYLWPSGLTDAADYVQYVDAPLLPDGEKGTATLTGGQFVFTAAQYAVTEEPAAEWFEDPSQSSSEEDEDVFAILDELSAEPYATEIADELSSDPYATWRADDIAMRELIQQDVDGSTSSMKALCEVGDEKTSMPFLATSSWVIFGDVNTRVWEYLRPVAERGYITFMRYRSKPNVFTVYATEPAVTPVGFPTTYTGAGGAAAIDKLLYALKEHAANRATYPYRDRDYFGIEVVRR